MKKPLLIAVLCCALPLVVIGLIYFYGGGFIDHSSMQQKPESQKADASAGNIFPDFSVIDIEGASLSNKSLGGKLSIIWFTTTWCTPCQIGAKKVAQLQREFGDDRLNVLVPNQQKLARNQACSSWVSGKLYLQLTGVLSGIIFFSLFSKNVQLILPFNF